MKVEFYADGVRAAALLAEFLPKFQAARAMDDEEEQEASRARWKAEREAEVVAEAAKEPEAEPVKRGRKSKAEQAATVVPEPAKEAEPEPAIRATPEDRQPVEDAEIVAEEAPVAAPTVEDVKAALQAVVAKHGMPYAQANVQRLLGAPKVGAIDPANYAEVIARLNAEAALEVDING